MTAKRLPVVLDCDTANEVDDQFAIAYALGCPALDVRGVVSVHNTTADGPTSRDRYQVEAERVVQLCGRDVPCVPGAAEPMERLDQPVASHGLDFLIAEARQTPLTLIATGPATDVASLILTAPEATRRLRVVWLGGFPDEAHYRRYARVELNGRADIAAWRCLWQSDVDLLQVPGWPGAAKLTVQGTDYAECLHAMQRPITRYLASILLAWVARHPDEQNNGEKILWDIATIASPVKPDAVTIDRRRAPRLDAAGAHDYTNAGRTLDMLTDLNSEAVFRDLEAALQHHPRNAA